MTPVASICGLRSISLHSTALAHTDPNLALSQLLRLKLKCHVLRVAGSILRERVPHHPLIYSGGVGSSH